MMQQEVSFGSRMRRQRQAMELSQAALGQRVGCSTIMIRKLEADERRPSAELAERLADVLGLDAADQASLLDLAQASVPAPDEQATPTQPAPARPRTNLTLQPTALIGRRQEVAIIRNMFSAGSARLVTLIGAGGIGKTRLAMEVAAALQDTYADGVWVIELAAVTNPALVGSTICQTLPIHDDCDGSDFARLQHALSSRHMLLVLDNFEQIVEAAPIVRDLLGVAPQLHILVTSRTPLRLRGEQVIEVPPLAVPPLTLPATVDRATEVDYVGQSEAVRCFVARARDARPDFALTPANVRPVAELCARLDGLPLAIELAAARVSLLPPEAMLERLGAAGDLRLKLLTGGARDLPVRHRTLRATIEWSYGMLNPTEQRVFARLAVFAGGWTVEAAESICGDEAWETLDALQALLDNSLVRRAAHASADRAAGQGRITMLETVREFAAQQLETSGEMEEMRRRHAQYFLALAEQAEPELSGPAQHLWLERLDQDHDNLRAALQWSVYQQSPPALETGLRLATALSMFWKMRGQPTEGRGWWEQVLAATEGVAGELRARALSGAGTMAWIQCDFARATELHTEALAVSRRIGDKHGIASALNNLGAQVMEQGTPEEALVLLEESLDLRREIDDRVGMAETLNNLGVIAELQGNFALAQRHYEEGLAVSQAIGNQWMIALGLINLGDAAQYQGDLARARTQYEAGFAVVQALDHKLLSAALLHKMGNLATAQGAPWRAIDWLQESLALWRQIGSAVGMITCVEAAAAALAASSQTPLDRLREAIMLWGVADVQRAARQTPRRLADTNFYTPFIEGARARLGEAAYEFSIEKGQTMPFEQALTVVQELQVDYGTTTVPAPVTPAVSGCDAGGHGLSEREREVLRLVAAGLSDKKIAERLIISPRTVQTHLASIYSKLGVNSRHAATVFALEHRLVSPSTGE